MPASSAAISCTTTPNRAYDRNIGTTLYSSAEGRTKVNAPIVRSGDSEHTSAATATMTRIGTGLEGRDGQELPIANQPPKDGDEPERDDSPAEAHLLFEQPLADAHGSPDATRGCAEQRMLDRRHQIAPPFRAVAEQVGTREREGRAVHDDGAGGVRRVRHPAGGDEHETPDGDAQPAHRSCVCPTHDEPVRRHGDRRDDGRDQAAVEVRERHGQRRGAKKANRRRRGVVETTPQREQVQRHPLGLRDVRVIGGLRQMERGERVGHRRDGRARRRERQITRKQVRRGGGQRKAEKDQPVVRGHRA